MKIDGLRDSKGSVRLCLTDRADDFPQCKAGARSASIKAMRGAVEYRFTGVAPGTYAIAAFHDANGNSKLDRMMAIPREGFAFSRNPPLKPRPPTWAETRFTVSADTVQTLRLRYML